MVGFTPVPASPKVRPSSRHWVKYAPTSRDSNHGRRQFWPASLSHAHTHTQKHTALSSPFRLFPNSTMHGPHMGHRAVHKHFAKRSWPSPVRRPQRCVGCAICLWSASAALRVSSTLPSGSRSRVLGWSWKAAPPQAERDCGSEYRATKIHTSSGSGLSSAS